MAIMSILWPSWIFTNNKKSPGRPAWHVAVLWQLIYPNVQQKFKKIHCTCLSARLLQIPSVWTHNFMWVKITDVCLI